MSQRIRPRLIVVCGAPASGKTTLARRLAGDLRLPLLEKDVIKESLAEAIGATSQEASKRIGEASYRMLYDLAFSILGQGRDVMLEANLSRRFAVPELARLGTISRLMLVQCVADREVIERRYRSRHAEGGRHAAHFDLDALSDLIAGLDTGSYDLTALGYPTISVRTDDGYEPGYGELVSRVRSQ